MDGDLQEQNKENPNNPSNISQTDTNDIKLPKLETNQKENKIIANKPNKVKKVKILPTVLVLLIVIVSLYFLVFSKKVIQTGEAPSLKQKVATTDLSKYDIDTDGDLYPDFIEEIVGNNPNENLYEKCYGNNPCENAQLEEVNHDKNILIILDASGSMQIQDNNLTRMDSAKNSIEKYITSSSPNTKFGIMVYGHKGSNKTEDKSVSCESAALLKSIGGIDKDNISEILQPVKPVGWTNMGYAINKGIAAFVGKKGTNEIILVSDGAETCNSQPVLAAQKAKEYGITVNIIGLGVTQEEGEELRKIAEAGGGSYAFSNIGDDLFNEFKVNYENSEKWSEESKCLYAFLDTAYACYKPDHQKIIDWAYNEQRKLYSKEIAQDEYDRLGELIKTLNQNINDIREGELKKVSERLEVGKNIIYR